MHEPEFLPTPHGPFVPPVAGAGSFRERGEKKEKCRWLVACWRPVRAWSATTPIRCCVYDSMGPTRTVVFPVFLRRFTTGPGQSKRTHHIYLCKKRKKRKGEWNQQAAASADRAVPPPPVGPPLLLLLLSSPDEPPTTPSKGERAAQRAARQRLSFRGRYHCSVCVRSLLPALPLAPGSSTLPSIRNSSSRSRSGRGALQEEAVAVAAGHFYLAFASLAFGLPPALRSLLLAPFLLLLLYPTPAQPPTFRPPTHFTSSSSQKKKKQGATFFFVCL
jgi:hypothetical protein